MLVARQTEAGSRSIAPFHSALKATKRKIGFGVSESGLDRWSTGQLLGEKANTMTDNVARSCCTSRQGFKMLVIGLVSFIFLN